MTSVNHKDLVDTIIDQNGHYYDDPVVVKIVEYTDNWGGTNWGLVYEHTQDKSTYDHETDFIHNPHVLWEKKNS